MKPYLLGELTWKTVKNEDYEIAILPWGATEAHNYHLPYATDNLESDLIAEVSAKKAWEKGVKVIVLPNLPYGVNTGQIGIKLDINLNPSTQQAILDDILASIDRAGIRKLVILNSHGGNDFKQMIRELGLKYPDIWMIQTNWYVIPTPGPLFTETGDHAGEMETSLMMHLCPQKILSLENAGDGKFRIPKIRALREGWSWSERIWPLVTKDTGIGNPYNATAEKGMKYFNHITDEIAVLIMELSGLERDKLYE